MVPEDDRQNGSYGYGYNIDSDWDEKEEGFTRALQFLTENWKLARQAYPRPGVDLKLSDRLAHVQESSAVFNGGTGTAEFL